MSHFEKVTFEQWKADCGIKGLPDQELKEWYDAVRLPRQATASSAGCDFFMPFNLNFESGSTFRVATGIRWVTDGENDRGKVLLIFPRSGLGFRYGIRLSNTVGVIDSDYKLEIQCKLVNDSDESIVLDAGDRYMQGVFVKFGIVENDEVVNGKRNGGMGSTGK